MFKFVIVLSLVACAVMAAPAQENSGSGSVFDNALQVYMSCSEASDVAVCLKLKALHYVDRAARSAEIDVVDGFKIVRNDDAPISRADHSRSLNDIEANLPADAEAKEVAIDDAIFEKTARFLSTHSVEVSMPQEISRAMGEHEEARGKKKKVMKLLPILLLAKMKLLFIPLILVGLVAFKALFAGKIALILSAILGIKKLLASKHDSYEVVAHPTSYGGHEDHHGWAGRSDSSDLAYNAYKPSN